MNYRSFLLGNFVSLTEKLMNSVVVVGLYYGFLITFSTGTSYLLLLQVRFQVMEEGKEAIEKEVAASAGIMVGQFVMFISLFYRPLRIALNKPQAITFISVPYLYYIRWSSGELLVNNESHSMRTRNLGIQRIFVNNLFCQLLNNLFFFPSTAFYNLLRVYMFRYDNKTLFLLSSFVGWLIGHILLVKLVRLVLVGIGIRQNSLVRSTKYFRCKKYLFYVFRFYRNLISDLRNSFDQIGGILVFFTCLLIFKKKLLPILTYKPKEAEVEIAQEKLSSAEPDNYQIRTNEQKKDNLRAEFCNRIAGLGKTEINKNNLLENKTRLGDRKRDKTLYLPKSK
jgi:hypothetical protein